MEKQAVRVFISYAHKDSDYKDELAIQLKLLKMQGLVNVWTDQEIMPGQEWDKEIKSEIEKAEIILLLISNDFLASDYINDVEIKKAFERYDNGEVVVIPIIIRPTQFADFEVSKFQALPKGAKPISKWDDADSAWLYVATGLKRVIISLQKKKQEKEIELANLKTKEILKIGNKSEIKGNRNIVIQGVDGGNINIIGKLSSPYDKDIASEKISETVFADARRYISKGKTSKAIELLSEYMSINNIRDEYDDLLIQSSRLSNIERQKRTGFISIGEVNISISRISAAILSIINDLEEELQGINTRG